MQGPATDHIVPLELVPMEGVKPPSASPFVLFWLTKSWKMPLRGCFAGFARLSTRGANQAVPR